MSQYPEEIGQHNQQHNSTRQYKKVNAYTKRPAKQQILAFLLIILIIILHSIFILPPIVSVIKNAILIFLLALQYILILMIIVDYLILTIKDPVDSLVSGEMNWEQQKVQEIRYCKDCDSYRFMKSYHCKICGRCGQNFDHHCQYLNNCVGGKNYQSFFRLLIVLTVFFIDLMIQAIWVFVLSYQSFEKELQEYMISRWPVLVIGIILVFVILAIDSLLVYQIYLNLVRKMSTVEYVFRDTPSNLSSSQSSDNIGSGQSVEKL